jgi:hypothetical protein
LLLEKNVRQLPAKFVQRNSSSYFGIEFSAIKSS